MRRLGCALLLLLIGTVVAVPNALAIPLAGDYILSGDINGTFTSDGSKLTAWEFTSQNFNLAVWNTSTSIVISNDASLFSAVVPIPSPWISDLLNLSWNGLFYAEQPIPDVFGVFRGPITISAVPEPTTLLLLAVALLGLISIRDCRNDIRGGRARLFDAEARQNSR